MKLAYSVSIATKMIAMVTFVIILAIFIVVKIATDLYRDESIARTQEANQELASHLAERTFAHFQELISKMSVMAQFAATKEPQEAKINIENVMGQSPDMISFSAFKVDEKLNMVPIISVQNGPLMTEMKLGAPESAFKELQSEAALELVQAGREMIVLNTSRFLRSATFSVALIGTNLTPAEPGTGSTQIPSVSAVASGKRNGKSTLTPGQWFIRADFRQDSMLRFFGKQKRIAAYIVDQSGRLMLHSDPKFAGNVVQGTNLANVELVDLIRRNEAGDNLQMDYDDYMGAHVLGAFRKVGVGDLNVVAELPRAQALATIKKFQYRSLLVMIVVVSLAFIVNFLFSKSITRPLQQLFEATARIVDGKFDVRVTTDTSDEVGALSRAFMKMAAGLKERDKLKGAFNKFHSKEIAQKLLSGELKLGGEKKQATVFFSDIRGFTAISESMTPDQVVLMLNEYMTEMVRIIYKWNGVVDKYIGDAIMAIWGVPETKPQDAYNALRASLEMREFLISFNERRRSQGKPEIKIGIGLHTGEVLAGNIGSELRLEYTIIGDTVNQASRVEAANKPLGADILITAATASLLYGQGFELGPQLAIKAKGKKDALIVHKVIGIKENGVLVTSLKTQDIDAIRAQDVSIEEAEEAKVKLASDNKSEGKETPPVGKPMPFVATTENTMMGTRMGMPAPGPIPMRGGVVLDHRLFMPQIATQYFVQDAHISPNPIGPFDLETIKLKVRAQQISYSAIAFKEGDQVGIPVSHLPGLERQEMPAIQHPSPQLDLQAQAEASEWYVAGNNGETMGPYSVEEVRLALERGNITRTTYVWNSSMGQWIYAYQIPGFDRRGPTSPPQAA